MPMYEFRCSGGHVFDAIVPPGTEARPCDCGSAAERTHKPARVAMITGGVGARSSNEPLSRGERYLAALHYGACVRDSGGKMRPPQTEGELTKVLAKHGHRRGTVTEFNDERAAEFQAHREEPKAKPISDDELSRRKPKRETIEYMKRRREWLRSKYDHGEIPQEAPAKEVPADVKPLIPSAVSTGA